jgi:hypothetical protein
VDVCDLQTVLKEPTIVLTSKRTKKRMKQLTGSESNSLDEDGPNSRNNIWNEYKDNIQTHIIRITTTINDDTFMKNAKVRFYMEFYAVLCHFM